MEAERQEEVGRVYIREDGEEESRVVFSRCPTLVGVINVAHLEFPGVKFDLLKIKTTKEGRVTLARKHEKAKMY